MNRLLLAPLMLALSACGLSNIQERLDLNQKLIEERSSIVGLKTYFVCQSNNGKYSYQEAIKRFKHARTLTSEFSNGLIQKGTFNTYSQEAQEWSDSDNADKAVQVMLPFADPNNYCQLNEETRTKRTQIEIGKKLMPYIQ